MMFGTVIRRKKGQPRQKVWQKPECDALQQTYNTADRQASRVRERNPLRALEMVEAGNAALIAAMKLDCRWVKRLRPKTIVPLRGALGRETVTCRRLKKRFQRYRAIKDQPGMIGTRARGRKLKCSWASRQKTRMGY